MTQNEITGSVAKLETVEKVVDDTLFSIKLRFSFNRLIDKA